MESDKKFITSWAQTGRVQFSMMQSLTVNQLIDSPETRLCCGLFWWMRDKPLVCSTPLFLLLPSLIYSVPDSGDVWWVLWLLRGEQRHIWALILSHSQVVHSATRHHDLPGATHVVQETEAWDTWGGPEPWAEPNWCLGRWDRVCIEVMGHRAAGVLLLWLGKLLRRQDIPEPRGEGDISAKWAWLVSKGLASWSTTGWWAVLHDQCLGEDWPHLDFRMEKTSPAGPWMSAAKLGSILVIIRSLGSSVSRRR